MIEKHGKWATDIFIEIYFIIGYVQTLLYIFLTRWKHHVGRANNRYHPCSIKLNENAMLYMYIPIEKECNRTGKSPFSSSYQSLDHSDIKVGFQVMKCCSLGPGYQFGYSISWVGFAFGLLDGLFFFIGFYRSHQVQKTKMGRRIKKTIGCKQ